MSALRWEEPPRSPYPDGDKIRLELTSRPGKWAVITTYHSKDSSLARTYAHQIRVGNKAWARPAGAFEAVHRLVDGEYRVYARYMGDAR